VDLQRRAALLETSGAAGGKLDLSSAQDAYDRRNGRRKFLGIGDGRPLRPLDQYRVRCVGSLDEFDSKSIRLGNFTHRQELSRQ
jgi:hypothetical protein